MCVVVNPGSVVDNMNIALKEGVALDERQLKKPYPCLLFFDSLGLHEKGAIGDKVREWLNYEWERTFPDIKEQPRREPFTRRSMVMTVPQVPKQTNGHDCGVFLCRYAFGLLHMGSCAFSYKDADITRVPKEGRKMKPDFTVCLANSKRFDFAKEEMDRMRKEFTVLIDNLTKLYAV